VFVEVKTRAALDFGDPVEAVHAAKRRSLIAVRASGWRKTLAIPARRTGSM